MFFDNLQLIHTRGPLLETHEYYPFGLSAAAISYRASGSLENKIMLTGNEHQSGEFTDGSGLELFDFNARMYDAQIGRFNSVDLFAMILPDWSAYSNSYNNPSTFSDPTGLFPETDFDLEDDKEFRLKESFSEYPRGYDPQRDDNLFDNHPDEQEENPTEDNRRRWQGISEKYKKLLQAKDYQGAVNLIVNSFPEEMGETPRNHIDKFTDKVSAHISNYVPETKISLTTYSTLIMDEFVKGNSSFGAQVRMIYHERRHLTHYHGTPYIANPMAREILAFHDMLYNSTLPNFDLNYPLDITSLTDHWPKRVNGYFSGMHPSQQPNYQKLFDQIIQKFNSFK